jgi:hypothetical protein
MGRKTAKGEKTKEGANGQDNSKGKKEYVEGWSEKKLMEVWSGVEKGEFELGSDDLKILNAELKRRNLGPYDKKTGTPPAEESDDLEEDDDFEEQVPIGYIKLYPETPERNEFYKKRYANAKKAWPNTKIIKKGEAWFIVAKGTDEHGYDVHLFITSDGTVHGTCTCADFTQRGVRRNFPCKHIFMVLVDQGHTRRWEGL